MPIPSGEPLLPQPTKLLVWSCPSGGRVPSFSVNMRIVMKISIKNQKKVKRFLKTAAIYPQPFRQILLLRIRHF
tara:strand:- start:1501 stop:1722 length:222 start_codon:yes stop_codon:yes gene_type:complete